MITRAIKLYGKAYGGLSPNAWWLALVMLINRSGTMVLPFMTMYLTQSKGISIGMAGVVMSLFGLGAILGALLGGKITDLLGHYPVQLFTLCGGGILFIILGHMESFPAICITTFFLSMVNEAFRPANSVAIAHYTRPENITRSYSLNRLAINLGWAFGGALGGFIAGYDYHLLFWVDGITNISAALLLFILLPRSIKTREKSGSEKKVLARSPYQDRTYIIFLSLIFFFAISFFQLFTTIPVFYKEKLHLSEFQIGLTMAMNGLIIAFFEMVIVFKLEGKSAYLRFIAVGTLIMGFSFLVLNSPWLSGLTIGIISMLIITIGEIISMPFMNSWWIARAHQTNRGQYAALFTVAWASSQAIGPFFGAQVAEWYGYNLLWDILMLISVFLCFGFLWLARREKRNLSR